MLEALVRLLRFSMYLKKIVIILYWNKSSLHFVNNIERYGISSAEDLVSLIKVITPKNKEFMFNQALPTISKNAEKLEFSGSEIAEIVSGLNPNNLKNIQIIADIDKFDIKDSMGCDNFAKFKELLKRIAVNFLVNFINFLSLLIPC